MEFRHFYCFYVKELDKYKSTGFQSNSTFKDLLKISKVLMVMTTETYWYSHLGTLADSWAPGRCGNNFTSVFLKLILLLDIMSTSCEIGLRWVPHNPIGNSTSTLVKVMAWCRQALHEPVLIQLYVTVWCHWPQWVHIIHVSISSQNWPSLGSPQTEDNSGISRWSHEAGWLPDAEWNFIAELHVLASVRGMSVCNTLWYLIHFE